MLWVLLLVFLVPLDEFKDVGVVGQQFLVVFDEVGPYLKVDVEGLVQGFQTFLA